MTQNLCVCIRPQYLQNL